MHRWLFRLSGTLLALALFVFAAGSATADQSIRVVMGTGNGFVLTPNAFNVGVGEKVTWTAAQAADSQRPHDLAIEGPGGYTWKLTPNGNVAVGQTGTGTSPAFTTAGTYTLFCPVGQHRAQGMTATINVSATAAAAGGTLPRSGEPISMLAGALGGLGALSLVGGLFLRRRTS